MNILQIGDKFINNEGDYCEIISIDNSGSIEIYYNIKYADTEEELATTLDEDEYTHDALELLDKKGSFTLIPKKVTNWRKEVEQENVKTSP